MEEQAAYISEFGSILLFLIGSVIFLIITFSVYRLLRQHKPYPEKLTTYESGEESISSAWPQFNIRFYVIALMFLLFEIELVFLFPWATIFSDKEMIVQTNKSWGWFTLVEVILFVLILGVGLAYAWVNGFFEWADGKQELTDIHSPVPKQLYEQINERYKRK